MKWSIIQLQKFRGKSLELNESVDLTGELKKQDPQIRDATPFLVTGTASITSEKVTFQLHLTGKLVLPCARTLVDVDFPIDVDTTEIFYLKPQEHAEEMEDDEFHLPVGDVVDLDPIIKEIVLLEIPMQVFSKQADDDHMPSGKDWEVLTEDQVKREEAEGEKKIDPRLAELAKFFDEKK
ncbi:YceD family protein [Heyndrickxia acidicola]|uniref:YceD family protein n=1 Tax=Heyndrickxia acidicola TaxID=209389 RepID=A0ABU6MES3_9BACI|nr:YceD family protein [Heyndrickxia acidicola]MED1202183.1 YceD family protein [Heyndrickxia acidicola]